MRKNPRLFENGYIAIKKARHGIFAFNTNDPYIGTSLDEYGEWTEPEMRALGPILHPGDIVVDVGAYIGTHTVFFAKKVGIQGRVYSIEPQRLSFNLLCTNVTLNNLINVVCLNKFAVDKTKDIMVPILDPEIRQNFGGIHIERLNQGEPIETLVIDSLKLPRVRLIKIDVEEGEDRVLEGAKKTIARCRPALYVENNTEEGSKEIIEKLFKLGYKCFWHIFNYYNPENYFGNKKNLFSNIAPEANMLCFPKEADINLTGFIEVKGINDNWRKAFNRTFK